MAALLRKGLRGLIRTTSGADNPPAGQRLLVPKTDGWYDRDSAGVEVGPLGVSGGGGGPSAETYGVVTSTVANSTVTPAAITGMTQTIAAGTYLMKAWLVYQAAATTTGVEFRFNFTGTSSRLAATWYTLTTGGAAATGIADQSTTLTAQMMEGKGQRASNAATGPTQGVDTLNADQFAVFEGVLIATGSGDIQVVFASEVAGSAVTMQVGSTLTLTKVA